MKELLETLDAWQAEGVAVGRAVLVRAFGSAPRQEGAVLLYAADGRIAGSVSGGCVEGATAREIERAQQSGLTRVVRYGISDEQAWDVGLACGGTIDVLIQPFVPQAVIAAARGSLAGRGDVVLTPLPVDAPPAELGSYPEGEWVAPEEPVALDAPDGELANVARDALARGASRTVQVGGRQFFIEAFAVRPRLVVVGAVEVARYLVQLAADMDFETVVVDGRPAFATRERFPTVDRLVVAWPDEAADAIGLGPDDAVAVMTHDPKFDEPAIVAALRRGCRYVGAIGARKSQAARRERLLAAGVSEQDLARVAGPIGLDLGGRAPAETALAILAEIVAQRHGASGGPLRSGLRS